MGSANIHIYIYISHQGGVSPEPAVDSEGSSKRPKASDENQPTLGRTTVATSQELATATITIRGPFDDTILQRLGGVGVG